MALKFEYDKEKRIATVCGVDDKFCKEIVIPATVEYYRKEYKVTSIKDSAFRCCHSLTSVIIGNSVTSIGEEAFYDCASLTSVTIGNSVTRIGHKAFRICKSLKSIKIPDSVTSIGSYAFYGCRSLTSVTIPNSVTSIKDHTFSRCRSLTNITIPNSVTSIGWFAFSDCRLLTSVTIGNGVTRIGDQAFGECASLSAFYGKYASDDNRCLIVDGVLKSFAPAGLTSYTIPDSVTEIDAYSIGYIPNIKVWICNDEGRVKIDKDEFGFGDKMRKMLVKKV